MSIAVTGKELTYELYALINITIECALSQDKKTIIQFKVDTDRHVSCFTRLDKLTVEIDFNLFDVW